MLEERGDEGALPWLKLLPGAVDGCFCQRGCGKLNGCDLTEVDLDALRDALDLLDDGVGQGVGVLPEGGELLLYPGDAFRGRVLPEDLVVLGERALALVDRAQEAGLAAVRQLDHAGLTVDEDPVLRHDADLDATALEQFVQPPVALAV